MPTFWLSLFATWPFSNLPLRDVNYPFKILLSFMYFPTECTTFSLRIEYVARFVPLGKNTVCIWKPRIRPYISFLFLKRKNDRKRWKRTNPQTDTSGMDCRLLSPGHWPWRIFGKTIITYHLLTAMIEKNARTQGTGKELQQTFLQIRFTTRTGVCGKCCWALIPREP